MGMGLSPLKFREIVLQLLFSFEMGSNAEEELASCLMQELKVSRKSVREAFQKAHVIWQNRDMLDPLIANQSREYSFDRIQPVEKNVLRLALFELLLEKQCSPKITISEALRLTSKFSTPEAAAFVNAIVDGYQPEKIEMTHEVGAAFSSQPIEAPL